MVQSKGAEKVEEQIFNQKSHQKAHNHGDLCCGQRDLFSGDWGKEGLSGGFSWKHVQGGGSQEIEKLKKKRPQPQRKTIKALISSQFHIPFDDVELLPISKYVTLFNEALNIGNFFGKDIKLMLYGKTEDQMIIEEFRKEGLMLTKEKVDAWNKSKTG